MFLLMVLRSMKPTIGVVEPTGGRYFAAMCRHVFAWWGGEDADPETGYSHLAHAGCCLLFLMEYQRNGWGTDDRFKGPDGERFTKDDGIVQQACDV